MKKILSLILSIMLICTLAQTIVCAAGGSVEITSPTADVFGDIEAFEASYTGDIESLTFILDGVNMGEATDGVLELGDTKLSIGNHILEAVAIFTDKTAAKDSVTFNVSKTLNIKALSENFDNFETNKNGWTTGGNNRKESYVSGRYSSENPNDKAYRMEYTITTEETSGKGPKLVAPKTVINDYGKGIVKFKFDIKTDGTENARVDMSDMFLWQKNAILIDYGKFIGTNVKCVSDWMSVELILDYDAEKVSLYSDVVPGGTVVEPSDWIESTWFKNNVFELAIRQRGDRTDTTIASLEVDNFEFTQSLNMSIDTVTCMPSNTDIIPGVDVIPAGTNEIILGLSCNPSLLGVTTDSISLTRNGISENSFDASINENIVSLKLTDDKVFNAGESIVFTINATNVISATENEETPISMRASTEPKPFTPSGVSFKKDEGEMVTSTQIENGDKITAGLSVSNPDSDNKDVTVFLCVKQNKRLVGIAATGKNIIAGTSEDFEVVIPEISGLDTEGDITVSLITCDGIASTIPYCNEYVLD